MSLQINQFVNTSNFHSNLVTAEHLHRGQVRGSFLPDVQELGRSGRGHGQEAAVRSACFKTTVLNFLFILLVISKVFIVEHLNSSLIFNW